MTTVIDSLVRSCVKKLQDIITEEAILILGVKEDLRELQRTMNQVQYFLSDAEERRTEESAVNNWLGQLKDAMYYADDIIDLARFEGGKLITEHPSSSRRSAACSSGFSCFTSIPNVLRRHEVAVKIRNFNAELDKISKQGETFLKLQNMLPKTLPAVKHNVQSSSLVEPNLVGKETLYACTTLVELVLAHKEKRAYKVGIVGTGGVGKTTLAQKIYNDLKIKGSFSKQAWMCVSQEYSEVALLKELLRNFGVHYEQDETVSELSSKLKVAIQDRSFFLVLDDVWHPEVWINILRTPLSYACTGVILVTTRHDTVAQAIGVEDIHRVDLMSTEVGWELLWKSMNVNEVKEVQRLQDIGMEIVRKCGGLPLAIKVIGRVLATLEKTEKEWRMFLNRSSWSIRNLPTELSAALYLSYDALPRYLKQCFLYCALYPEDRDMDAADLSGFWVAEGFVEEQEGQFLEDTALEYYYELINRNLLQPDPLYLYHGRCKMHDVLRQLAQHISGEEFFCGNPESSVAKTLNKCRRVSVVTDKDSVVLPGMDKKNLKVRTLVLLSDKPLRVEKSIFRRIPCIRVLDLSDSLIQSVPDSIGSLIHLRLLDLCRTDISYIPESIGSLINLQILNLVNCDALHLLPMAITRLCNLRRLDLEDTPINQVPKGIGRLEFLNDLEGFPVSGGSDDAKAQDGWKLEELVQLPQLRRLDMIRLERAVPHGADLLLADKKYLKVLSLCYTEQINGPYSEEDEGNIEKVTELLIPPQNLEDLKIEKFSSQRYPVWLGTTHLSSLKHLNLKDCKFWEHLPPIGQLPNLKNLRISGATAVKRIGPEFLGFKEGNPIFTEAVAFPQLEWLSIEDMPNLEEWCFVEYQDAAEDAATKERTDGSAELRKWEAMSQKMQLLPSLKELQLVRCPKLRALPQQLGQEATSLKELYIRGAGCLKAVEDLLFLSGHLKVVRCVGLKRISNLPQVKELHVSQCTNLRYVAELSSLQQLWLHKDMSETSSCWVPELQQQHRKLYDEDLDIYTWAD